jgi:hypothetical protein
MTLPPQWVAKSQPVRIGGRQAVFDTARTPFAHPIQA